MKNIAIVILSVVLAASIISGIALYGQRVDTEKALQVSEKKAADSNDRVGQLNQEIVNLRDSRDPFRLGGSGNLNSCLSSFLI